jgi:hypothetical protein
MLRFLITSTVLVISIILLGYSLHDGLRSNGIVEVFLDFPGLKSPNTRSLDIPAPDELGSKLKSKVSDVASQITGTDIPDKIDDVVPGLATRASELKAQATAVLDPLLEGQSLKVTLGSDRLCYTIGNDSTSCQRAPSQVSDFFPAPINGFLDIDSTILSTVLAINVRISLVCALIGTLALTVVFIFPFFVGLALLQVIPGLRLAVEILIFLLALLPLLVAAIPTFVILSALRSLDALTVTNGNLVYCLGVALATMILCGILFFRWRCR